MNKEINRWKLSFYKDMDLARQYVRRAIEYLKYQNVEEATERLEFISHYLSNFLSDYDEFIYEERLKDLD